MASVKILVGGQRGEEEERGALDKQATLMDGGATQVCGVGNDPAEF